MKRFIALALLFALLAAGAFGMERTIGGGVLFNASSTIGTMNIFAPDLGQYSID